MAVSRFAAAQGQTVRLRVLFKRSPSGDLYDPDDLARVEIHRRTGTETTVLVETIPDTSIVRESEGVYFVDWAVPSAAAVGTYEDHWTYTPDPGGTEKTDAVAFQVFLASTVSGSGVYTSVGDVRANVLPNSPLTDTQIQELIDTASQIADRYCGRFFDVRTLTLTVNGTGAPYVTMKYKPRVISSIVILQTDGTTDTRVAADFRVRGRMIVHKNHRPWPRSRDAIACTPCCTGGAMNFPYGHQNVEITGQFGMFDTVPAPVKAAVELLVQHGGADGKVFAPMAGNYAAEASDGTSRSLRDAVQSVAIRGSTGIPEVDHKLNLFRNTTGRIAVLA